MESRDTSGSTGQLSSADSTGGGMHHSLSTPAGVDGGARTPPATPKKGGKMLAIRVQMLDDTVTIFQVQAKALGRVLFDQVCKQLHLLEADYFGLEYQDMAGTRYWLDLQKPISRQLGLSLLDPLLLFCVKFYTPDPGQLEEEYTRYLYCLQVKRDLSQGLMHCNDNTAALMASYIVQAECGDFVSEDYPDHTYLSSYKFVPHQDHDMERKIMENHKKHSGQSPAEADLNLLETARRCELYGIKMHPAKDHENVPLNLAVAHMGIVVYQHITKINTFSWAKIRKLSFKRKKFLIKLHPEGYGYYKDTVEFFFEGRNECKNFWKKCVENHGFFRCSAVKSVSRHKTRVLSRGSSFRYSGKTQKQIVEFVRDNYVKRQTFQRSASFRHSSAHSSANNMHTSSVGNSISAHPLLPLADSNLSVEVSKLSASLGAMGAAAADPISPTTKLVCPPQGTPTCWNSVPDNRLTTTPAQMMNSPSPPLTTQSGSPETSVTTSPHHILYENTTRSSPVAVRAAVHRADTGTIITTTRTPSNRPPSQTQSQNDLDNRIIHPGTPPKRHIWQRSSSCRELYDFSFEDSGQAKRRVKVDPMRILLDDRKLESPITRYDDHRLIYANSQTPSLEIHQDIMMPDQKVYSSSYPGTTSYSQESVEDPGNYELRDSQDDLSHDSYELLEKSDDDYSTSGDYKYAKTKSINTRSCSLDSGNYLPSDSESEIEKHKCKSSTDLQEDIFEMEDPRDFPREIIPRKSDGSYYKTFKSSSRTSSLESKSDYYESKPTKSSKESLKKTKRGTNSRTSSQESKSDYEIKKSSKSINGNLKYDSRTSSQESKSEYYDAHSEPKTNKHSYDRKIEFERNYGTQKPKLDSLDIYEINQNVTFKETSHVHSISLQNVETEQNIRCNRLASLDQNTVPRTQKPSQLKQQGSIDNGKKNQITHIWPESIVGVPTQLQDWSSKPQSTKSTESESNIFSFDEDKIQSLQESDDAGYAIVPSIGKRSDGKKNYRDVFVEIEPRRLDLTKDPILHQPIERTKSDPNNLGWQRLNSNSRRMLLKHQKSIDLTPAESSDDEYLYKQIPSAPPIMKYKGTHFEIPTAEFGHFDILKREIMGQKTQFEVPKRQFEVFGAKTQSDFINLPPKNETDIPYVLHKRHIMNGTSKDDAKDLTRAHEVPNIQVQEEIKKKPKSPVIIETEATSFLFTQNIDLSKVDPVTLEIDKSAKPIQHLSSPKRDITRIDPALLETLNSKLSQIESDSPTSSKTESLKPLQQKVIMISPIMEKPKIEIKQKVMSDNKIKTDIKPKRIIKPRMQPGKKGKSNKTKIRITSFSSDDESLDSDDVFGSAEATPTKLEFSPPQTRKEMESILKHESERKYLQYTMSSTEVEGSPPTTRKSDLLYDRMQDPNYQTELRRISERSLSIPSSEDDFNMKTSDLQPVFEPETDDITLTLETVEEVEKELDKSVDDTIEQITVQELLKETALQEIDEEKEKEKIKLIQDIESDIADLKVPSKTKITEICSPSMRKKGQSPLLFAHARLNLSEGSAFSLLQKQKALDSPISGRRAKSLDTAIISVNRLPALNSFSSKDDTLEEEDNNLSSFIKESEEEYEMEVEKVPDIIKELPPKVVTKVTEQKQIITDTKITKPVQEVKTTTTVTSTSKVIVKDSAAKPPIKPRVSESKVKISDEKAKIKAKQKSLEKDQIVPDVISPKSKKTRSTVQTKSTQQKSYISKAKLKTNKDIKPPPQEKSITTKTTVQKPQPTVQKSQPTVPKAPTTATKTEKNLLPKSLSLETPDRKENKPITTQKSLPAQNSLQLPEIKRTKSQELESCKKPTPKEKAKSLEKLEFKRTSSKERTKSQEESDTDIAKRKEYQQMLYETAIKQTKTVKSPVKDIVPVFPEVEEMVRERGGKLEISINTIENTAVNLEDAIIITKSPKKLDKKLLDQKLTKSLEIMLGDEDTDKSVLRLGKSLDLDPRNNKSELYTFDFKIEAIDSMNQNQGEEALDTDTEETLQDTEASQLVLEGTSLDVWISVDNKPFAESKLENIKVIETSDDFFEAAQSEKPPDLAKLETKSSSDSHSIDKFSLGNSLEMKYIDESGDSSYKSDTQLTQELQKATKTMEKLLLKKLENRRRQEMQKDIMTTPVEEVDEIDNTLVRITSEEESLTSVSELKGETIEQDFNLLGVSNGNKDAFLKLSTERSRSEDTGSWMTLECEEFVGAESFEYDNNVEVVEKDSILKSTEINEPTIVEEERKYEETIVTEVKTEEEENTNLLSTKTKYQKMDLLKRYSDQSRSSDTTGSWTSGEKDLSPGKAEESSVSCSIGRAIGLSQTIEKFSTKEQMEKTSPDLDAPRSPRSPRICILGRTFTIDEDYNQFTKDKSDSSSEAEQILPADLTPLPESDKKDLEDVLKTKKPYPFEEKWSSDSELAQRLQIKLSKKLSSSEKNSFSSVDESYSERRKNGHGSLEKPSLYSVDRLSAESRNSLDTESSSGSIGLASRVNKETGLLEPSCTWKRFPLESGSCSSSLEEIAADTDLYSQDYFLSKENFNDIALLQDVYKYDTDATPTKESVEDVEDKYNTPLVGEALMNYSTQFLSRTLSRISERSTNSEKTSVEEESTKGSTRSDSLNDESIGSIEQQGSLSSDSPIRPQVQAFDKEKKESKSNNKASTISSGKEKEKNGQLPNISSLLQRQISDDRRTSAEMADLSIDDIEIITSERGLRLKRQNSDDTIIDEEDPEDLYKDKGSSSSQESEDWPLPEIPQSRRLMLMHDTPSSDNSQPTTQLFQPPNVNIPKIFGLRGSLKSQDSEQWPSPPSSVQEPHIVGNVETHYITPPEEACKVIVDSNTVSTYDNDSCSYSDDNKTLEYDCDGEGEKTHTYENVATDQISESISESLSVGPSGVKIVVETKSGDSGSNSDELCLSNLNDDVFTETLDTKNELRPPTVMRRSTTSDDSSHSHRKDGTRLASPKDSHSSYSEEDGSSMGTTLEDGTVRYAFKPTKCTHSSHSEDTSIALSLSEWSNSTTTVKFQTLSTSNSGKSSGLKSDDNSLTDIAHSISEWSSSNSNTLKAQSLQFQKLSSSTGDSSTLTDMLPPDWSRSDTKCCFQSSIPTRLPVLPPTFQEEEEEIKKPDDTNKFLTRSTERPMMIPVQIMSDEKSTESSSIEQRTVHTQRYDKDKQKYQKHQIPTKNGASDRQAKVPLKLSKCSPYYSSSLSSESTPMATSHPISLSKTATIPLTRSRKPVAKGLFHARSPPSENDSTSSMESPKCKSEPRDRRGYRRRRHTPQKRHKVEKDAHTTTTATTKDDYYSYVDQETSEYNEYIRNRSMEELACGYTYENIVVESCPYTENLEEGYYPDGDSQSGSDIFRMEKEEDDKYEVEGFDVSCIPPPLIEDDFEIDRSDQI